MPANQSLAVRDTCKLETAIREIDVAKGSVILTRPQDGQIQTIALAAGETETFDPPQSGFDVFSPEGARFHLTYETDPVGTEEARNRGPKVRRSSQPRRKRSTVSRRSSATKTASEGSASAGKASGSGARKSSRGSKRASSNSGARKKNSTKSAAKKKG